MISREEWTDKLRESLYTKWNKVPTDEYPFPNRVAVENAIHFIWRHLPESIVPTSFHALPEGGLCLVFENNLAKFIQFMNDGYVYWADPAIVLSCESDSKDT